MNPELIVGSIAAWVAQALERSACSPCRGKPVRVMTSAELAFETSRAILNIHTQSDTHMRLSPLRGIAANRLFRNPSGPFVSTEFFVCVSQREGKVRMHSLCRRICGTSKKRPGQLAA